MSGLFHSGIGYRSFLVSVGIVVVLTAIAFVGASRSFIEDVDAENACLAQGYVEAKFKEKHHVLTTRYGCKRADAIAFIVVARKEANAPAQDVTVCCGTWFSGCAVRAEK